MDVPGVFTRGTYRVSDGMGVRRGQADFQKGR